MGLEASVEMGEEKQVEGIFHVGHLSAWLLRDMQGRAGHTHALLQWNKSKNEICQQEKESKICYCPMKVSSKETFENCFWLKVRARVQ